MTQTSQPEGKPLQGRAAVVTGASRGIGRAIALRLARDGANVAVLSRNFPALSALKDEVETLGARCFAESCNVTETERLEIFLQRAAEALGPITILVNNAGIYATEPLAQHSLDSWQNVMASNLTSAMWASKCLVSAMIKVGWGRIVNISSVSGKSGEPYGAAYSASKFAMLGLTQSLALETARHGVTVNAVCPGWVETDMALNQLNDRRWCELNDIAQEQSVEIAKLSVPQERFIEPDEVAALVAFLCTHDARGITGQAINICGGLSLH